jgi:hypothetical protein
MLTYAAPPLADCFPRARLYAPEPSGDPLLAREPGSRARSFPYRERHLQCAWFDAALRPAALSTADGETVTVEDPGVWNLEAGPDFLGAALRIGPERRHIAGDVEIHIHPNDWRSHGHGTDPRYASVRAHVTFFPGRLPPGDLPPGCVQVALKDALAANPFFSFENVDLVAYPFATRAPVPPCMTELKAWPIDARSQLLDAAGEERLRRKAERMLLAIEERGRDQVVYEEIMAALGYKQNKQAFRHIAALVTLDRLRAESAGSAHAAYALLLGVSGLMPADLAPEWDDETRGFVRGVWDAWWKMRDRWAGRALARSSWNLAGLRPLNHPARRLMAAAELFAVAKDVADPRRWQLDGGYWRFRQGLGGKRSAEPIALVGEDRVNGVLVNVTVPLLAASGRRDAVASILDQLPGGQDNAVLRQTALNLFGQDHTPKIYNTGLRRQGLVQVFHDYCLNDRSRCASCSFPALLRAHGRRA